MRKPIDGTVLTSDGIDRSRDKGARTDGVPIACKLPETIGIVDWDVGDGASVLCSIDVAKGVSAGRSLLQVRGEERSRERSLGIAEESLLLYR